MAFRLVVVVVVVAALTLPPVLTATNTSFDCAICLRARTGINPTTLECSHSFCPECISSWIDVNPTCPMCRRPAIVDDPTEPHPQRIPVPSQPQLIPQTEPHLQRIPVPSQPQLIPQTEPHPQRIPVPSQPQLIPQTRTFTIEINKRQAKALDDAIQLNRQPRHPPLVDVKIAGFNGPVKCTVNLYANDEWIMKFNQPLLNTTTPPLVGCYVKHLAREAQNITAVAHVGAPGEFRIEGVDVVPSAKSKSWFFGGSSSGR